MFSLFRRSRKKDEEEEGVEPFRPDVGEGRRVYAIGDVHGRSDLLTRLLKKIVADNVARADVAELRIVLLGDLVDRGPESADVVDIVMDMAELWSGLVCLKGNHEEVFLLALSGDANGMRLFRRLGLETLLSYGVDAALVQCGSDEELFEAMIANVPETHRDFLRELPNSIIIGDYLFVHAGIRPGVPMEEQEGRDMRWIRESFLSSNVMHPYMVIHGHSITDAVDEKPNRIGIDTGAYFSDRLTAIGLEGTERWYLST